MNTLRIRYKLFLANTAFNTCLLALTVSLLASCSGYKTIESSSIANDNWTLIKAQKDNDRSFEILARKLEGTNLYEYKIEGHIKSSSEACLSSFKSEIQKLANGAEPKKYPIYKIIYHSKDSLLTYVVHNEPFPLRDTEMSVRYIDYTGKNGQKGVMWTEAWDENVPQPTKKLNRIDTFRGSWSFTPTENNSTYAINTVQFDPKRMPRWLVEPMVTKFLKKELEVIRQESLRQY